MTECNQSSFGFEACGKREVLARFDDGRNRKQVEHSVREMLAPRIYGLALGYEDLNDQEQLRHIRYSAFWRAGKNCRNHWALCRDTCAR